MQIDFTGLFNANDDTISIDYTVPFDDFVYSTYYPIKNGVNVKGQAFCKAEVSYLELNIEFDFNGVCDRCAEDVIKHYSFSINKIVLPKLENDSDDNDDYIVLDNNILDLDEFVWEEVQLFLPQKMLCKDDCKGLCFKCGKNLNEGKCDCEKDVDPRMAALLELLDD